MIWPLIVTMSPTIVPYIHLSSCRFVVLAYCSARPLCVARIQNVNVFIFPSSSQSQVTDLSRLSPILKTPTRTCRNNDDVNGDWIYRYYQQYHHQCCHYCCSRTFICYFAFVPFCCHVLLNICHDQDVDLRLPLYRLLRLLLNFPYRWTAIGAKACASRCVAGWINMPSFAISFFFFHQILLWTGNWWK